MESNTNELKLTKFCKNCLTVKFAEEFYPVKGADKNRMYYATYCIVCENARKTEYNRRNVEKRAEKRREKKLLEPPKPPKIKIPKPPKIKIPKPPKIKTDNDRLYKFNRLNPLVQDTIKFLINRNISVNKITNIVNELKLKLNEEIMKYKQIHYICSITYLPKWSETDTIPELLKETLNEMNIEIYDF